MDTILPAAAEPQPQLLRVRASCPACGAPPALRVCDPVRRAAAELPAGLELMTYRCQRRRCGAVYRLTAGSVAAAR